MKVRSTMMMMMLMMGVLLSVVGRVGGAPLCLSQLFTHDPRDACGGVYDCPFNQYCDDTHTCVTKKSEGSCESDNECMLGYSCNGPDGSKQCYVNAGVGQQCSDDSSLPASDCANALSCNPNNTCVNGRVGDACAQNDHCRTDLCQGGRCAYKAAGADCGNSNECAPDHSCDGIPPDRTCQPKAANGASCSFDSDCASDLCEKATAETPNNNRTCIAPNSVAAGGYCEETNACASELCYNNYCLGQQPVYCTGGGCAGDEVCHCGGEILMTGYGKCKKHKCTEKLRPLVECVEACEDTDFSYSNSCASLNCAEALDTVLSGSCSYFASFFI